MALFVLPCLLFADKAERSYPTIPPKYSYQWQVEDQYSNNNYGQDETRDGDSTTGSYFVLLPDGRTQKVSYTVDAYGGYKAEVTYEGEAKPAPVTKTYQPKQPPKYQAQSSSYKPIKVAPKKKTKETAKIGEVYYKPLESAPEAQVYYKPLPKSDTPAKVYYKPIEA